MLADEGIGEWGFSALVEADGHRILVDTGARPDTVLQNARELHVELSNVEEVVLTHFHADHVGGLLTLRRELKKQNPGAISQVHVAQGIFYSRPQKDGTEGNPMISIRKEFEAGVIRDFEETLPRGRRRDAESILPRDCSSRKVDFC